MNPFIQNLELTMFSILPYFFIYFWLKYFKINYRFHDSSFQNASIYFSKEDMLSHNHSIIITFNKIN